MNLDEPLKWYFVKSTLLDYFVRRKIRLSGTVHHLDRATHWKRNHQYYFIMKEKKKTTNWAWIICNCQAAYVARGVFKGETLDEKAHVARGSMLSETPLVTYVTLFAFPLSTHDNSNRMPYLSFSFGCYAWFESSLDSTRDSNKHLPPPLRNSCPRVSSNIP